MLFFIYFTLNAYTYIEFTTLKHSRETLIKNPNQIIAELNKISETHILVMTDWGIYYFQHLYGNKDQILLFITPLYEEEHIQNIKEIALRANKNIAIVRHRTRDEVYHFLISKFPSFNSSKFPISQDLWEVLAE